MKIKVKKLNRLFLIVSLILLVIWLTTLNGYWLALWLWLGYNVDMAKYKKLANESYAKGFSEGQQRESKTVRVHLQ